MTQKELLDIIYSVYPKVKWDEPNGHKYKNTIEHKRYKSIRALRLNNYSKKLATLIKKQGYIIINENRSHDYCFKYTILCERLNDIMDNDRQLLVSLGGARTDVYLYVSKIAKIFTMECEQTQLKQINNQEEWTFQKTMFDGNAKENFNTIYNYLISSGLQFINMNDLDVIVPDIETEYTDKGETTVFNLLFTPGHEHFTEKTIIL